MLNCLSAYAIGIWVALSWCEAVGWFPPADFAGRRKAVKQIVRTFVIGASALALSAGIASAQVGGPAATRERQHNVDFTDTDSSCHGLIQVIGKMHVSETTSPTQYSFKIHQLGDGVGLDTGYSYQYQNWSENSFQTTATNFTSRFTLRKHIIRTGGANLAEDDLFMLETIKVHVTLGVPVIQMEQSKFECK
jgi:hypothetical protein